MKGAGVSDSAASATAHLANTVPLDLMFQTEEVDGTVPPMDDTWPDVTPPRYLRVTPSRVHV